MENVYFHINHGRSSLRIGSNVKLTSRYCRHFEILERIRPIPYKRALPATMKVHDALQVSFLNNYVHDVDHVIEWYELQEEPKG